MSLPEQNGALLESTEVAVPRKEGIVLLEILRAFGVKRFEFDESEMKRVFGQSVTTLSVYFRYFLTRGLRKNDLSHKCVRLVRIGEHVHRNVAPRSSGPLVPARYMMSSSGLR